MDFESIGAVLDEVLELYPDIFDDSKFPVIAAESTEFIVDYLKKSEPSKNNFLEETVAVFGNEKNDSKSVTHKKPKKKKCNVKMDEEYLMKKKEKSKKKKDRKEKKRILAMTTGLDRGLIPKRITAINEYKGIILHEIEWTDSNHENEIIPSPILSAQYPQVVIQFYESNSYLFNTRTNELKKVCV